MFDKNQIVETVWNNANRQWYIDKGYSYTKNRDKLYVKAKDLPKSSRAKVVVTCDICKNEYETTYSIISNNTEHTCKKCAPDMANKLRNKREANDKITIARKICECNGYTLITNESDYEGVKGIIRFLCPKHGEQKMIFDNFLKGHKCRECGYEAVGKKLKKSPDEVKRIIESNNGNELLNKNEYIDSQTNNLKIKCKCGNVFIVSLSNYIKNGVNRCKTCSQKESKGELLIRKYLESNNIEYVQEKRFKDCKDIKPLPFDFYLPKYNLCIEFDGQYHYMPIISDERLNSIKAHDKIKNDYCLDKKIQLLRIPYYDGNYIQQILENIIK